MNRMNRGLDAIPLGGLPLEGDRQSYSLILEAGFSNWGQSDRPIPEDARSQFGGDGFDPEKYQSIKVQG